jgi:exodeoxyribonuclease V beta subunit
MSLVEAYTEFDLCGPLPAGVTALEASAGTGKTYAIAALAARYVAEGTALDRLLLITFTRIATGELRDRVRERLVDCEQALSSILAGAPPETVRTDEVTSLLATGTAAEVCVRRDRLARAVADFDAATIATTHGFCQEVLAELGTIGDLDRETEFVEDVSELLEQTLDDLYVRRFGPRTAGTARFTRAEALQIARAAVENPMARLEPRDEPKDSTPAMRYRLADRVRRDLDLRKRRLAIMTYDDLLTRLRDILVGPNGAAARARLRARYDVVLVDEFQDTDPIQWQILSHAFATEGVTLVLVADPKQAIYAFRGAEVYAYLEAARIAGTRETLLVNRRSDQPLLDAFDALFADARLGHPEIVYRRLRAAPAHQTSRLRGAAEDAALRIRVVHRDQPSIELTNYGYARAPAAREHVARDLAADVVRLLDSSATLERRTVTGAPDGEEPICPRHIAVLVRTHANAELICGQLEAARVPAVINGGGNVFDTAMARAWLRLLEALERPASALRARTAAATPFLGWSGERIATAGEPEWEEVHRRLHRWSRILRDSGVAALTEAITVSENLAARMLAETGGERRLTDSNHIAQLLHRAASAERLGVTALRGWLAERTADAAREDPEDERTRRLESDAEAVQILTIHRSKGLEFPIVYCPFLWEPSYIPRDPEPVFFHDPQAGFRRTIDVGLEGRAWNAHVRRHRDEQRGEDLRLAYVALTRAKHQAVIWWAGSYDSRHSPLGRLLFAKGADGNIAPEGRFTPTDEAADTRFAELAAKFDVSHPPIALERSTLGAWPATWAAPLEPPVDLAPARFDRRLDEWWRRTSYSDITSEAHEAMVGSEPEQPVLTDEPSAPTPVAVLGASAGELERAPQSPLGTMPVGVAFGTFVHRVFEATDFAAADLDAELAEHVRGARARSSLELGEPDAIIAGLGAAIETPLGPLTDDRRLRDITRRDRLDELEFELPLVGGDSPTGELELGALARALVEHLPAGDPMAAYAARLEDPSLRSHVRGFLTGSIDLVARIGAPSAPRFVIADYKTNWLGPADEPLTLAHYRFDALVAEMSRAHYSLQALLYTVALHRYLRWRLPGYDPDRHLGGVLYLFVRGMAGGMAGGAGDSGSGVFAWRPPGRLVVALSDVLGGAG